MKRFMAAAVSLLMTFALATVSTVAGPVSTASAAPPGGATVYGATGTGQILNLNASVLPIVAGGLNLANAGIATTNATTSSTATPRSAATSSNIAAAVAGLPLTVVSSGQTAPPDNAAPTTGGLPDVNVNIPLLLQLQLNALQVSNQARWSGDTSCVAGGLLSDSKTTTGDTSLTLAGTNLLTLGAADVRNTNSLVNNATNVGLNKGVESRAVGTVTDLKLLNDTVLVTVTGNPTLVATATGTPGGATATSNASSLVVSVKIGSNTAVTVPLGGSIPIAGLGTLQVNAPTNVVQNANGQNASASWNFLTLNVNLAAASATVQLLPMTASATAPAGGLDCPPPAPVILVPAEGATVTTATPTISGTAQPNATVTVTVDGSATPITTTADGTGAWSITSPVLVNGAHTATATQTVAGVTSPATAVRNFTVAVPAPAAPVIVTPADNTVSNNRTPVITGTGTAGNTITVFDGATSLGTTTVVTGGTWTLTAPTLSEGLHTFTATQQAATGPASAASNAVRYTVDITAPAPVTITTPAQNSTVTDTTPTITGAGAEDGATVIVTEGGTELCRVTVTTGPGWSCTPATPLAQGSHTIVATQTDAAGNVGVPSAGRTFSVDSLAPLAVTITDPAQNSTVTDNTPTITGAGAEDGATVVVTEGGTELCRVTVTTGPGWSCTPTTPLAEGSHTIVATQTDAAGNVGAPSAARTFIVDALSPGILTISDPAQNSTVTDNTPTITGAGAEDGATVIVREGGTELCRVTVTTGPGWSCTPTTPLAQGSHTINATQTDAAGNIGPVSADRTFSVDSLAPLAVTITDPAQNSTVTDTTPTITGAGAEDGATVIVTEGGTELCRVTVTTGPGWSCTPATPLAQGSHTINATQTDAAGNVGTASAARTFIVDSIAPDPVTIVTPAQNSTVADTTPTITGAGAEDGATVIVREGGTELCRVTVTTGPGWSCTPITPLAQGSHTINATQTDAAGNIGPVSADRTFSVDSLAPLAVTITDPAQNSTVTDATPTITGAGAEDGATVIVREGITELCRVTVTTGPGWSCTPTTPLAEGAHAITATQTDAAGNVGPASALRNFSVDSMAPAAVTISEPAQNDRVTDTTPAITGAGAEDGATVIVREGGTELCRVTVTTGPGWSCTPITPLAQGSHTISAAQTDGAGNVGPSSADRTFIIDSIAPDPVTITTPVQNSTVTTNTPLISGAGAEDGATVIVTEGTTEICRVTVTTGPSWSCTPTAALAQGPHTISAAQTDLAGNVGPDSADRNFSVDSVKPLAVSIDAPENGDFLPTARPVISGDGAEAGATVIVKEGTVEICRVTVLLAGAWACTPTADLAEGEHTIVATQTDLAGNVSPNSNTVTFTVDTVNPNRPIITTPAVNEQVTGTNVPVTGTGEAGSTISVTLVTDDVLAIQYGPVTAVIAPNGTWTVSFAGLAPANYIATAFQTDQAGNRSPLPDPSRAFTVVSDVRDAPVIASPTTSTVPVSNNRPVISGTGVAGAVLTVRDLVDLVMGPGGTMVPRVLGTTTVGSNGSWTLNLTADLGEGGHRFQATQAGTNGVPSAASNVVDYVVDTVAAPPVITAPTGGTSAPQHTRTPRITGDGAEPGATIIVRDGNTVICTTVATASGTWTCTPPDELAEGSHTITATQTDKAGNISPASAPVTFVIEIRLDITSPPRLNRTKDNTPSVGGTSDEVGAQITVSKRGSVWCRTTVSTSKTWSCSSPNAQPNGFALVSATARSIGGFTKNASAPVLIVIDTLRPGAPRITSPSPNALVPVGSVNVRGTGAPGSTLTLSDERGVARGEVFVSLNGTWTISVKGLAAGSHSFTAVQIDGAKNVSAISARTVVTAAGTNGVAGVRTPVIDPTLDKQSLSTTTPRISGVGQRGAKIVVSDEGGRRSATITIGASGNWALAFPSSPQGIHTYTATQTYQVGTRTVTVKSQVAQARLDTAAPAAPTLEAPLTGDVQTTTLPAFGGSAEGGVVVEATIDGKVIQPRGGLKGALSDNDRRWILLSTVAVGPGNHTLRLVAVDPAGNRSPVRVATIRTN